MTVEDDLSIAAETELYRRIREHWLVPDQNRGCRRISSAAFSHESLSVVVQDRLVADGRTTGSVLEHYPGEYLAALTAGFVREHEQKVVRTPRLEPPPEPAHGDVVGKKNKPRQRLFASRAAWAIGPQDACPPVEPAAEAQSDS